jgi:OOP family OmpA-OmpF porin
MEKRGSVMKVRVFILAACMAVAVVSLAATAARAELRIEALDPPLPLTIVGWFAFDPNSSEDLDTSGIAFSNALYDGYRDLSKARRAAPDPKDGELFNHKARTAARRSSVLPDWPSDRELSEEDQSVFHSALHFMNTGFERGGREVAPQDAATAQVSYDCWIEAAEYGREDDIKRCRQAFWDAMNAVSAAADYELTEVDFEPRMAPQAAAVVPALEGYLVYFEWDSTAVTPAGQAALQESIRAAEANAEASVSLIGHADRSGAVGYNQGLSERRALVIIQSMTDSGIARWRINWNAVGESQPLVPTADGVREQGNRVVEVDLL